MLNLTSFNDIQIIDECVTSINKQAFLLGYSFFWSFPTNHSNEMIPIKYTNGLGENVIYGAESFCVWVVKDSDGTPTLISERKDVKAKLMLNASVLHAKEIMNKPDFLDGLDEFWSREFVPVPKGVKE